MKQSFSVSISALSWWIFFFISCREWQLFTYALPVSVKGCQSSIFSLCRGTSGITCEFSLHEYQLWECSHIHIIKTMPLWYKSKSWIRETGSWNHLQCWIFTLQFCGSRLYSNFVPIWSVHLDISTLKRQKCNDFPALAFNWSRM